MEIKRANFTITETIAQQFQTNFYRKLFILFTYSYTVNFESQLDQRW